MHIYFLGIGGAGIGPLAQIAAEAGYEVSGSDNKHSAYIDYLKDHGLKAIEVGSSPELITTRHQQVPIDWLVYSSALDFSPEGAKQLAVARSANVRTTKRDAFIQQLVTDHKLKLIAIAGTHGKTTTTAMVVWLFKQLNLPLSYLLPAKVSFGDMGEFNKASEYLVIEADEFDHNFLSFSPHLSLISGVSWDHHEIYPTRDDYISAFRQFIEASSQTLLWDNDASYLKVSGPKLTILDPNELKLEQITLLGEANRRDGYLAASGVGALVNQPAADLIKVLNKFPGLSRRMEEIVPGLYSDYAHTPDKIKGSMSVARELADGRQLIVVYEPLTNRRQAHMLKDYKDSFEGAEHVYWLESYLAREDKDQPIIAPSQLISHLSDPAIAEPAKLNGELYKTLKSHLDKGAMVVAMAGGGADSLDDWLRDRFILDQ